MKQPFCVYKGHSADLLDVSWSKVLHQPSCFYASASYLMGCWRHYAFNLFVLCMLACVPGILHLLVVDLVIFRCHDRTSVSVVIYLYAFFVAIDAKIGLLATVNMASQYTYP